MAIPLKQTLDDLPPKRRAELDRRFKELVDQLESLKKLRYLSEKSSAGSQCERD
jgi:hypothetical protein